LENVTEVLLTNLHIFGPLGLHSCVKIIVYLRKRSCTRLSPQLFKLRNIWRRSLTQRLVSLSSPMVLSSPIVLQGMGRDPNKGGKGSKNMSRRGDPNRSCTMSMLPLLVFVCLYRK